MRAAGRVQRRGAGRYRYGIARIHEPFMKRALSATLLVVLTLAASGCATIEEARYRKQKRRYVRNEYPVNSVKGLRTAGVIVVSAAHRYPVDTDEFSARLHGQLQQVEGLEVISNGAVLQAVMDLQARPTEGVGFALPRDGLKLADEIGVDGLFVAIVTEYDPYGEPVLALGLTLFSRAMPSIGSIDLDKVIAGGRPLPMPDKPGIKPVTAVFAVYDAAQQATRRRIRWFAEGQTASDMGLGWERHYRSMPNYMRFVSYEVVWKLFENLQSAVSAASTADEAAATASPKE